MFPYNEIPDSGWIYGQSRADQKCDVYDDYTALYLQRMNALPQILTRGMANGTWLRGMYYAKMIGVLIGIELPLCAACLSLGPPWSLVGIVPWLLCTYLIRNVRSSHRRCNLPVLSMTTTSEGLALLNLGQEFMAQASLSAELATESEWQRITADGQKIHLEQLEYLVTLRLTK